MKTDALIQALAADHATPPPSLGRGMALALLVGGALTLALFLAVLGVRANAVTSLGSPRFVFKFVATGILALTASALVLRLSRPGAPAPLWMLLVAPVLLALGVAAELVSLPASAWLTSLFGTTWKMCLVFIPMLSLAPLAAILLALRRGAPTSPALAGMVAGLLAGGIGAFVYAAHCPGDSPLFLAAWYSLTIVAMALVGGAVGSRMLRW